MPPVALGLLAQLPSILGGLFTGAKQKRLAKKINPVDATYQVSKYAKENLATAQNAYNARMPGAASTEQNIAGNEANQFANIDRNAGDSSQALAVAAGVGGQTNQAYNTLAGQEAGYKQTQQEFLSQAMDKMSNEEKLVFQDQLRKYYDSVKSKQDLMRSGMVNQQNAFNKIGDIGSLFASGQFGKQNAGNSTGANTDMSLSVPDGTFGASDYTRRNGLGIMMPRLQF